MVHFFARMVVESVEEAFVEVPAIRMPHTVGNDTALLLTVANTLHGGNGHVTYSS